MAEEGCPICPGGPWKCRWEIPQHQCLGCTGQWWDPPRYICFHLKKVSALKNVWEDLVSAPTCKELRRHHSHPYHKKKADQMGNQWLFLDSSESWGCRGNHHLKSGVSEGSPNRASTRPHKTRTAEEFEAYGTHFSANIKRSPICSQINVNPHTNVLFTSFPITWYNIYSFLKIYIYI